MPSFLVLGPMEIRSPHRTLMLRGVMQQTLLAALLASAGRLVTVGALIEELWGPTPPSRTENALQAQISRLRRTLAALEPDRAHSRLATMTAGYQFSLEGVEFDATTLLETVSAIRARAGRKIQRDIADMRKALALWRGPVFGGITGGPICQAAIARYQECYTTAHVLLCELELQGGEDVKIVPELSELVAKFPLQESFCELLMVALYRCGRQTDALAEARRLRNRLIEELGVEPSPPFRGLEKAILNHDSMLVRAEAVPTAGWACAS
jgi:SARP family transcriptional regulator, regulator of embCAB operon